MYISIDTRSSVLIRGHAMCGFNDRGSGDVFTEILTS